MPVPAAVDGDTAARLGDWGVAPDEALRMVRLPVDHHPDLAEALRPLWLSVMRAVGTADFNIRIVRT